MTDQRTNNKQANFFFQATEMAGSLVKAARSAGKRIPLFQSQNAWGGGNLFGVGSFSNLKQLRFQSTAEQLDTYSQISSVYTCVRTIAHAVAALPVQFTDEKGQVVYELGQYRAEPGSLAALLEKPNKQQKFRQFIFRWVAHYLLAGNALVFKENQDGRGRPEALYCLNPASIRLIVDPYEGLIGYVYENGVSGSSGLAIDVSEVFHGRQENPVSQNEFWGLGTLMPLIGALNTEINIQDNYSALFRNGAVIPGAWVTKENLSNTQWERLKAELRQNNTGVANWYTPSLLDGGLEWKSMTVSYNELGVGELRKYTREEIFMTFGVPLSVVGNEGAANVKNDHLTETFIEFTLRPIVSVIEEQLRELCYSYDERLGIRMPLPAPVMESELVGNVAIIDSLTSLSVSEKRKAIKTKLGEHFGLADIPDEMPVEEQQAEEAANDTADTPEMESEPAQLPGVTNFTDLTVSDSEDDSLVIATDEAGKSFQKAEGTKPAGPGSRGGVGYIDAGGKWRYGKKPGTAGTSDEDFTAGQTASKKETAALKHTRAENRSRAKEAMRDPATGKTVSDPNRLINEFGWEAPDEAMQNIPDQQAARELASKLAKTNPESMFVVVRHKGKYHIVAKLISELPPAPPKKKPDKTPKEIVSNVGGSLNRKQPTAANSGSNKKPAAAKKPAANKVKE